MSEQRSWKPIAVSPAMGVPDQARCFKPIALPGAPQHGGQPVILPAAEAFGSSKAQPAIPPIFLKRPEAARALGISASLLAKLTARGEIAAIKIGKRGIRYRPCDLQDWADRQAAR